MVADAPPAFSPDIVRFVEVSTVPTRASTLRKGIGVRRRCLTGGFPAVTLDEVGVSVSGREIAVTPAPAAFHS